MTNRPRVPLARLLVGGAFMLAAASAAVVAADAKKNADERVAEIQQSLKSGDVAVRRSAIGSLVHSDISLRLLPEMQNTLKDADGDVRSVAATAIGNLGAAATTAVPELMAQLKSDPMKEARETAARALGRIGKAAPDERRPVPALRAAAKDDADAVTRVVALGALAMMPVETPEQIVAIRKFLHHEEPLVRMKAAHALGMLGAAARAAAPEIVPVLANEPDGHRRGYVARALGNVGDPASLPALQAALAKETDNAAKGEMRGAIRKLGGEVPK